MTEEAVFEGPDENSSILVERGDIKPPRGRQILVGVFGGGRLLAAFPTQHQAEEFARDNVSLKRIEDFNYWYRIQEFEAIAGPVER
jgi:hypothetical protein